jgi:uncharacterized iron-regulated membrane protein
MDAKTGAASNSGTESDDQSRRWRSLWRIHFYSGMFAMPFVVVMALTGLVILYTQPIQDAVDGRLRTVPKATQVVSYDIQASAVEQRFPNAKILSLTPPVSSSQSTAFDLDDGSKAGRQVFVNPHTGAVLGSVNKGGGVVGFANRMHGFLNASSYKISLPTVSAFWDHGAVMRPYVLGDLMLEMLGGWTLVLIMSGIYLWWPRRRSAAADRGNARKRFGIRRGVTGRARWRDLHGFSGVLMLGALALTIVSGMAWSTYWGPNFTALANSISPNAWTDSPASVLGVRGDLDRLGNATPWNTADRPIPASYATPTDGSAPAPLSLDSVVAIAKRESMKPGFIVKLPTNKVDETTGTTLYGSFTISNSWPRKTGEGRDLFLDQFSGTTRAEQTGSGYGKVSYAMDTLVNTHMGTQLGLVNRIVMTAMCILSLWSVFSALVMFRKRRRPGTLGVPRRPVDVRLARRVALTAAAMGVVFPVWGLSAAVVLGFDRLAIRRTRLRSVFGQ